tara:strand:- start:9975 stop:11315 length:1341 start_codon:yes stop_codon:yes gene_type:complete
MMMNNLKELINHLNSSNDSCSDVLKIRSSNLNKELLDRFNIKYEEETEAITIDLSRQVFKIFKKKKDVLSQRESLKEEDTIIVIEDELLYENKNSDNALFENIFFSKKLKNLFIKHQVISYDDEAFEILIFLSEKMGKLEVGYSEKDSTFFYNDNNLKKIYELLAKKLTENEYNSFLRDNFIRIAKDIKNSDSKLFYITLMNLDSIYKNANREFELYKNKFSFENFLSEFHEEKEKYIKTLQENLSDFLSKINSLPIQFGVYILLVFRFKDEVIPLVATIILIVAWSAFSINSLNLMKKSIIHTKKKFENIMAEIIKKSGVSPKDLEEDKIEVLKKIENIKTMIRRYRYMVIIFSIVFIAFSSYNIYKELNKVKSSQESKIIEKRNEINIKKSETQISNKNDKKSEKEVIKERNQVTDINSDKEIKRNNVPLKETDKKDNISKFFE